MSIQRNLIAIGAQNGYFFVYDLDKNDFIVVKKIHMGGIEGLIMRNDIIATCSSDDTINITQII